MLVYIKYTYTYIHIYTHAYINTYICTHIHEWRSDGKKKIGSKCKSPQGESARARSFATNLYIHIGTKETGEWPAASLRAT